MTKPVGVALWHLNTRAMPGAHEPTADDKLLALRRRVTAANEYFQQAWLDVVLPRLRYRFEVGPIEWQNPPDLKGWQANS